MNQERTIMGACDYSIASLQKIKKTLMDYGSPQKELNWAIGGIIITLSSNLLRICQERLLESVECGELNAQKDIRFIQTQFNELIDKMLVNNAN